MAWAAGSAPWWAPLVQHVQLGGLALLVLLLSLSTQQWLGALASAAPQGTQVLAADAAAMLGLAELLGRQSEAEAQGRLAPRRFSRDFEWTSSGF